MKYHTFKKRYSNKESLVHLTIINFLFALIMGIRLIYKGNIEDIAEFIIEFVVLVSTINLMFAWPFFGTIGKYRWRINKLYELYSKSTTISEKIVFPTVKIRIDKEKSFIYFNFLWAGKVSIATQKELEHRLSEILFPKNEFLLEEPRRTQAYTIFVYSKKPERLQITYEKE